MLAEFERAEENYRSAWWRLGQLFPNAATAESDGLFHIATGFPSPLWNCTLAPSGTRLDPNAVVDSAERFFQPRKVPYSIRFPASNHSLADACLARGLARTIPAPFMLASTSIVPTVAPDLVIGEITDAGMLRSAVEIECEAFETDAIRTLYTDVLLADGRTTAFLGTAGGVPVGTAQLLTSTSGIGLYDVAVAASHRRRGIATALVTHAMSVAGRMGFAEVTLDSSEMARSLYERLGFRFVGEYTRMQRDWAGKANE